MKNLKKTADPQFRAQRGNPNTRELMSAGGKENGQLPGVLQSRGMQKQGRHGGDRQLTRGLQHQHVQGVAEHSPVADHQGQCADRQQPAVW